MIRRLFSFTFTFALLVLSGCTLPVRKELPDLSQVASEAKEKVDQVKKDVQETTDKIEEKAEDIQNAVKAVDKVFGEGEE